LIYEITKSIIIKEITLKRNSIAIGKDKKTYSTRDSLVGKEIFLKPITLDDALQVEKWRLESDPEALNSQPQVFSAKSEIEAKLKEKPSINEQSFSICRKDDSMLLGEVRFYKYNPLNRSAEISIIVDPQDRESGYAKDALATMISYLFRFRDLNKVYSYTPESNEGAVAMFKSLNFEQDGALRDHHFYDGAFSRVLIFSLLRFQADF
jgi:RimJ/RimL family protein N-acetyltransferase